MSGTLQMIVMPTHQSKLGVVLCVVKTDFKLATWWLSWSNNNDSDAK